jgi:uncharacterized protein YjbI with pentapeptide repeats
MRNEQLLAWSQLLSGTPVGRIQGPRTPNGMLDLRGINVPFDEGVFGRDGSNRVRTTPADVEVPFANWEGVDFSSSVINRLRLRKAVWRDCRFDGCKLQGCTLWSPMIERCSFVKAKFRETYVVCTQLPEGGLRDCSFFGADFRGAHPGVCTLLNCDLSGANVNRVEFSGTAFRKVVFGGVLRDTLFQGPASLGPADIHPSFCFTDVDLRACELIGVHFRSICLGQTRFPEDEKHLVFTMEEVCRVERRLGLYLTGKLGAAVVPFCDASEYPPPDGGRAGVIHLPTFFSDNGADVAAQVLQALRP